MFKILFFILLSWACNDRSLSPRAESTKTASTSSSPNPSTQGPAIAPVETESEIVDIPAPVIGSYLFCTAPVAASGSTVLIQCALRDLSSDQNIALSTFKSYDWTLIASSNYSAKTTILSGTSAFQVEFLVSSQSGNFKGDDLQFRLDVVSTKDENLGMVSYPDGIPKTGCSAGEVSYSADASGIVVPPNCTSLTVRVWGAGGAAGLSNSTQNRGGYGGSGGYAESTMDVAESSTSLQIKIGQGGLCASLGGSGYANGGNASVGSGGSAGTGAQDGGLGGSGTSSGGAGRIGGGAGGSATSIGGGGGGASAVIVTGVGANTIFAGGGGGGGGGGTGTLSGAQGGPACSQVGESTTGAGGGGGGGACSGQVVESGTGFNPPLPDDTGVAGHGGIGGENGAACSSENNGTQGHVILVWK